MVLLLPRTHTVVTTLVIKSLPSSLTSLDRSLGDHLYKTNCNDPINCLYGNSASDSAGSLFFNLDHINSSPQSHVIHIVVGRAWGGFRMGADPAYSQGRTPSPSLKHRDEFLKAHTLEPHLP